MRRASGKFGKKRQSEHQNTHAPDPVGGSTPEHQSAGESLEHFRCDDAGTGGGQAGDRFKKSVFKTGNNAGNHKRKSAEQTQENPAESSDDEAFLQTEMGIPVPSRKKGQGAARGNIDQNAVCNGHGIAVMVNERDDERWRHGNCLDKQQRAEHPDNQSPVHL